MFGADRKERWVQKSGAAYNNPMPHKRTSEEASLDGRDGDTADTASSPLKPIREVKDERLEPGAKKQLILEAGAGTLTKALVPPPPPAYIPPREQKRVTNMAPFMLFRVILVIV